MKRFISLAAALLLFAASYAAVTDVSTLSQLANAVSYSSDTIHLTADITYGDADGVLYVPANKTCVIDFDLHEIRRDVTHSANTIRPAITIGRGANLTLINGGVVCNNTLVDASVQPCAVYMPGDKSVLNLEDMILVGLMNGSQYASNAYGLITDDQEDITINARLANINCLYLKNLTHVPTLNLYRVNLGSENRKNAGGLGLKADAPRNLQGTFVMGMLDGTNLSGTELLELIPDQDMKYFDWNTPSAYAALTRAQIAQMTSLQSQSFYFFPDLNFSVSNTAVTYTNCDDILSDGKARFDFLTNTLYLKNTAPNNFSTLSGIYWTGFNLTVEVEGKWRSGQILSYDGDLTVRAHHRALTEEDADLLSVTYVAEEPFAIHDADIRFKDRIKIYAESDRTHDPAFLCRDIFVEDSWLDAWGKSPSPVANYRNAYVFKASVKVGSFRNNDVIQIEPQFTQYYLHVQSNGRGTVTGEGWYNEGTEVTISATPNEGYYFDRWYEDGSTDATRTITVTKDATYTALFFPEEVINYYDVTVLSADETMGTVSGGGTHIEQGQTVTITATPKSGYEFLYWTTSNGQVQGRINEWTVTADEILTAHFRVAPPADALTLWVCGTQVTGSNSADILGDGVWSYDDATRTLTVMKDATYNITNDGFIEDWAGSGTDEPLIVNVGNHKVEAICTTTDNTLRNAIVGTKGMTFTGTTYHGVTLTAQNMYAANFSSKPLTVTGHMDLTLNLKNTTDWGKDNFKTAVLLAGVTPSLIVDGANLYINSGVGESASLGYKVTNKTDQAANLSMNNASIQWGSISDKSLGILDDSPKYEINYLTPALESLCLTSAFGLSFFEGTHFNLYAYPAPGYKFVSWSDGNTDNPRLIIMPAYNLYLDPIVEVDESIVPKGAIINANVTEGQGTITNFTSGWYAEGTELTITAQPAEGYEFVQWSDGVTENPRSITVEDGKNINITAVFKDSSETTGIDSTTDNPSPVTHKYLRNGLLFIERNGKTYNAQGHPVPSKH